MPRQKSPSLFSWPERLVTGIWYSPLIFLFGAEAIALPAELAAFAWVHLPWRPRDHYTSFHATGLQAVIFLALLSIPMLFAGLFSWFVNRRPESVGKILRWLLFLGLARLIYHLIHELQRENNLLSGHFVQFGFESSGYYLNVRRLETMIAPFLVAWFWLALMIGTFELDTAIRLRMASLRDDGLRQFRLLKAVTEWLPYWVMLRFSLLPIVLLVLLGGWLQVLELPLRSQEEVVPMPGLLEPREINARSGVLHLLVHSDGPVRTVDSRLRGPERRIGVTDYPHLAQTHRSTRMRAALTVENDVSFEKLVTLIDWLRASGVNDIVLVDE